MESFIGVLFIALVVGGVLWNRRNGETAMAGVEFRVTAQPRDVATAIATSYCSGARAKVQSIVSRIKVYPNGTTSFRVETGIGDKGIITVNPSTDGGSIVSAHVTELYIGSHPMTHWRGYFYGFVAAMAHRISKMLGLAPYAGHLKRFQAGIERRIAKQLPSAETY